MKKILLLIATITSMAISCFASTTSNDGLSENYLQALISSYDSVKSQKSIIFDASQSYLENIEDAEFEWNFGDGNKNEGIEVLHSYKQPGEYTVSLKIVSHEQEVTTTKNVFVFKKQITLISDKTENKGQIENFIKTAKSQGILINTIDSYGSSTEFISEEILTKKINERAEDLKKADQILIWTKENAGLNSLSRYLQNPQRKGSDQQISSDLIVIDNSLSTGYNKIQRQFNTIGAEKIVVIQEAAIYPLIETTNRSEFLRTMEDRGYQFKEIQKNSDQLRPWNFMSYFVSSLINQGIPDNTIALILLLPVIALVVTFMKQVVGITTFGIYTPSIITLSFLIIGLYAGLLTLFTAILVGAIIRPLLGKIRMLYIPKMAIVITILSLSLLLILIFGISVKLFNAEFISIAIFPMLILTTLVEKFISVKSEKGFFAAAILMIETLMVSIVAYLFAGGEISIFSFSLKIDFIKNLLINYPEFIFLILILTILLGRWTGLRIVERIRFREVLRHLEE